MKTFGLSFIVLATGWLTTGFQIAGSGENRPTVQSAVSGGFYVRSVPQADFGNEGKTQVFRVKSDGDELLDEYPVYMRGKLYLGWSPIAGEFCLVHVEPERITSNNDYEKLGKVSRLAFYMGGKEVFAYSGDDLEEMGLQQKVQTLVHRGRGQFLIHGIRQVPRTNQYVLEIEKTTEQGRTETLLLDITDGTIFRDDSEKEAEPNEGGNSE